MNILHRKLLTEQQPRSAAVEPVEQPCAAGGGADSKDKAQRRHDEGREHTRGDRLE